MPEGPITRKPPATPAIAAPTVARKGETAHGPPVAPPPIFAPMSPSEAIRRLDRASKQGRLPGFERRGELRFRALVYGEPFDREMLCDVRAEGDGCVLGCRLRLLKRLPTVAIALIVVSIWPGVWLTDSMIQTYFPGYPNAFWVTAVWYLPLTVVPLPWILRSMWRKSEGIAQEELVRTVGRIVRAVDGTIEQE